MPPRPSAAELNLPIRLPATTAKTLPKTATDDPPKEETTTPAKPPIPPPKDPRLLEAETRLQDYKDLHRDGTALRCAPAALKAYFLWRTNADLPPGEVAKVLREPPLQTATVVMYILTAVRAERLGFDRARMRREVLSLCGEDVLQGGRFAEILRLARWGKEV